MRRRRKFDAVVMGHAGGVSDVDEVIDGNMSNLHDSDVFDVGKNGISEYQINDNHALYTPINHNSEQYIFAVFVCKKIGFAFMSLDYSRLY